LRAFLYSTAINILKWETRRRRVRRIVVFSETGELPHGRIDADDTLGREAFARFHGLLDRLGRNDRTAFGLHYIEGHTFDDVVQAMGGSLATAKRRVARASTELSRMVGSSTHSIDQNDEDRPAQELDF